ncbi:putative ribonuclease H-like domain-containing protein [Tanacetum coccineum]
MLWLASLTSRGEQITKIIRTIYLPIFFSQIEPKKVIQALANPSWVEAMQEELLQFKLQKVWTLVNLPKGKNAIRTKWVYRNKKDERGIIVRNKARLVAQGSGYQQKDRKPSQNDKTEHGMEKTVQNQGQSPKMPKSESIQKNQQSNRSRN